MVRHHLLGWTLMVLGAMAFGYIGYDLYSRYDAYKDIIAHDRERAIEIESNRTRTNRALLSAGVDSLQASRGFWYTHTDRYGNQSVFYYDPDQWSLKAGLQDGDIAELVKTVASSTLADRELMRNVPENELPPQLRFNNQLYTFNTPDGFKQKLRALEAAYAKGTASADELWQLSYMYELEGNYAKREEVNAASCKKYKAQCASDIAIWMHGTVTDLAHRPIQGATVRILSHPEVKSALTDAKGMFAIRLSVKPMEKVRASAVKRNFSEGVASTLVLNGAKKDYEMEPIVLGSPISIVTLDTEKHTVTDPADEARADGSFVLHATSSTYEIPSGAIVRADGTPYRGVADVYLYEFTRDTVPASLITVDIMDQVLGYAGNLMKTFGMPYIQFFSPSGEELHVMKSKPMLLTYKLAGMHDLRANTDGLPEGPLTQLDMQTLVSASAGDRGFPVTYEFLVNKKLLTFPPFWAFDRKKGVWENVGMRVLDIEGTIQAPFYTINDTQ